MRILELLKTAIKSYELYPDGIVINKQLHPNSLHGDLHYKITIQEKTYSARFIRKSRYEQGAFVKLTNEVLTEQIRFCNYLSELNIPFMKHCPTISGEPFATVLEGNSEWRFVLFQWINGKHITHCTESMVEKFGRMARNIHDISEKFQSTLFEKKSHLDGYAEFLQAILKEVHSVELSKATAYSLRNYIDIATGHLNKSKTDGLDFIIQSDLNPLNIIWSDQDEIIGIVDFESITYTNRVEGLAWLIKWYSRTHGIHSHEMSSKLVTTLLNSYGANELLQAKDFQRLPSLLWLSGCMNWNFSAKTIELLKKNDDEGLQNHLTAYLTRGKKLISLCSSENILQ